MAKGDSAASSHYWRKEDAICLHDVKKFAGPSVMLPNKVMITASQRGQLSLSDELSSPAQTAMILPQLKSASLISIGQLCDDECDVILNKRVLVAIKNKKVILTGIRNKYDKLWDIPIHKSTISPQNYSLPEIHPSIYSTRTKNDKENIVHSPSSFKTPSDVTFKTELNQYHDLIDHNILDNFLKKEKRTKQKYCKTNLSPENPSLAVIIRKKQTHAELVDYLHGACFSPVKSTFEQAIKKNFFKTWPGLTRELVAKHLHTPIATVQGHQHQERQKLQSTKPLAMSIPTTTKIKEHLKMLRAKQKKGETLEEVLKRELLEDQFPISDKPNIKKQDVIYAIIDKDEISTAYTDLTGRFPMRSSMGNQYILVGYHYDSNCILGHAVKDRKAHTLTAAWRVLHATFAKAGVAPKTYVMDNEISAELLAALQEEITDYQLVPPHTHRRNLAERAIQTYKNHFKAGLASVDPNFPLSQWDNLIEQANITLNLLRSSRVNPKLSAYSYIFGEFNFAATPLAPPGTKIVSHKKPNDRGTWELNGEVGWYVGPSMHHYRCVKCYFPRTRATRDCDTVTFFPTTIPFPQIKLDDYLRQAATDIITILTQPPSTTTPSLQAGDPVRNALLTLATQLKRIEPMPPVIADTVPSPRVLPLPPTKNQLQTAQPPRVHATEQVNDTSKKYCAQPPRVLHDNPLPTSTLQVHSKQLRNARYKNATQHSYPLRSQFRQRGTNFKHLAAQHLTAQHAFQPTVNHIFQENGKKETIDRLLKSNHKHVWTRSLSNEWGRLAQGNKHGILGTDTIEFIFQHNVPKDKKVTYATYVVDYRPLKEEKYRVRITVGGDKLVYLEDSGSPAANLLETKILVNSTISHANDGARFMSADIKDYFLATPMEQPEYMKVQARHIPADILLQYNLQDKVTNDNCVYIKIKKGMYGLKQAAVLAYNNLKKNLKPAGYTPIIGTVGMWQHTTRRTKFCLCVDDFGIKYYTKEDAHHLLQAIGQHYKYTTDWKGNNYCGLTFNWQYDSGYVDVSMPDYIEKALTRLQYEPQISPQYSPHACVPIQYATKNTRQYATAPDTSPLLSPMETKYIQSVTGSHLYYGRAIDYTILPALNEIASEQAHPTQKTKQKAQRLMDYVNTYKEAYIRYKASDMVLHIDSDAAYLVAPKARSRVAGYFHLSDHPSKTQHPTLNGAIHVECKTLRHVVSSAAEAETGGVYHNAQTAIPIRIILQALNHPQPPTPIKTDNSTAHGFIHDNIHQKRSKSWDMRYYWLRDRKTQQQFLFFWDKGVNNEADYFTKHHPTKYHRHKRNRYVQDKEPTLPDPSVLRGCVATHHDVIMTS